jgi:Mn-dependent DtxR family transcriptional regulator
VTASLFLSIYLYFFRHYVILLSVSCNFFKAKINFYLEKEAKILRTFGNESAENYLETILVLSKKLPVVRSVDIANELGFKKSSVSVAMKNLREKKHITVSEAGFIFLTDSGREIAEMIYERHEFLTDWLVKLGVSEEIASEDACRIEHVISSESFEAIKRHIPSER